MATSAADPQGQEGHSLTRAGEDYLESIYRLSLESAEGDKSVRSVDVAEQLEVSKASVNKALSQLKEMGMVVQSRYGRVVLTEEGEAYAKVVWRSHRALRTFLEALSDEDRAAYAAKVAQMAADIEAAKVTVDVEDGVEEEPAAQAESAEGSAE